MSFKQINVGESAGERLVQHLNSVVGTNLRGNYTIAVLGGKGGAGKTVTTAAVGSMFKSQRSDPVVAIDADPAQAANLASRIDPKSASVREIIADDNLLRYSDVRSYTGKNAAGLDVVASPRHASSSGPSITPEEFSCGHNRLQRFYNLLLVDCGVDLDHPVMPEVLGHADTIVMVASAVPDGAVGASTNFEWLHQAGYQQLLSRMVLVLNHIRSSTSRRDKKATRQLVATLIEHFSRWVPPERIFEVPFDPHIATAGIVELDALKPATRRRVLEVSAALASGFSSTTDQR
uniref:CobQ/CobB/MinD/ParA nucleotide binding domain protein n=1 Tax=Mycobacterium riyadhense TaxID=486698 RepID=A0A653EXM9_9MYCO|nr:CobQ/CobB/MinD/ParA nucleotide binding domain protein [Mycobacterium riyadhense]